MSSIKRSVIGGNVNLFEPENDVRYREVYAIKCRLHKDFVRRVSPSFCPFHREMLLVESSRKWSNLEQL